MTGEELREMTTEEMRTRVEQLKEEQFRLRFRAATVQLENPVLLRTIRRDIARIKTVLRERELAGESAR
ncbi:MAG: 50S ribosomal protein L29 [Gemmatimonadetes bacterium]|jgi:large subunit ribosomal protein L29|nr:50S ribosomal protein L29 [Gemmatimonadota bacterium]MBA3969334.1 50S ribosomal protein L29 [Gemmatimonadota bacterium]MDQ3308666.1 50S ribosomal protein L29 [Gemmatimonadota bacterium]MDQ3522184.1 50S ribosomal protein L29 [Gemmatimonadota bacterium]